MSSAGTTGTGGQKPARTREDMQPEIGHAITAAAFLLPALAFAAIGYVLGTAWTAAAFATLWIGLLFSVSLKIRRKRTFLVIERFGKFWKVVYAGFAIVIPFIDNIILDDVLVQKSVQLFRNEPAKEGGSEKPSVIEIDFVDGSAPIDASAWYQVGNPSDIENGNFDQVTEDVLKYTYLVTADERAPRVAEIFQGAFRVSLESVKISDAQKNMETLAKEGTEDAKDALKAIGVYPFPSKGIIVRDIDLPEALVDIRENALRGEMQSQEAVNASRGLWEPVLHMKAGLARGVPQSGAAPAIPGVDMTMNDIIDLFKFQKSIEAIGKVGKLDIVSSDVGNALKVISVGNTSGGAS